MKAEIKEAITKAEKYLETHPDSVQGRERLKTLNWMKAIVDAEEAEQAKKRKPRKRFVKPELDDVIEYFERKGFPDAVLEGNKFMHHYESNGWKVGKNKMVSWESAASGWMTRNKDGESKRGGMRPVRDTTGELNKAYFEKLTGKKL